MYWRHTLCSFLECQLIRSPVLVVKLGTCPVLRALRPALPSLARGKPWLIGARRISVCNDACLSAADPQSDSLSASCYLCQLGSPCPLAVLFFGRAHELGAFRGRRLQSKFRRGRGAPGCAQRERGCAGQHRKSLQSRGTCASLQQAAPPLAQPAARRKASGTLGRIDVWTRELILNRFWRDHILEAHISRSVDSGSFSLAFRCAFARRRGSTRSRGRELEIMSLELTRRITGTPTCGYGFSSVSSFSSTFHGSRIV